MSKKTIEWGTETITFVNEVADAARGVGIPGIGLIGRFAQGYYDRSLLKRFERFCEYIELDEELLAKLQSNEDYANCFYSILETIRRTHSKLGILTVALLYRDHYKNPEVIIPAVRSFAEIDDATINAFIVLYESIPIGQNYTALQEEVDGETQFHRLYREAVDLINRNIFLQSASASMSANMPIQAMIWDHTKMYYEYCKKAKEHA